MSCSVTIIKIIGEKYNETDRVHRIEIFGDVETVDEAAVCSRIEARLKYPDGDFTSWAEADVSIIGEWQATLNRHDIAPDSHFKVDADFECGALIYAEARCTDNHYCHTESRDKPLICEVLHCPTLLELAVSDNNDNAVDWRLPLDPGEYEIVVIEPSVSDDSSDELRFQWSIDGILATSNIHDGGRRLNYELVSNQHDISVGAQKDICPILSASVFLECTTRTPEEAPPSSIEEAPPSSIEEAPPSSVDVHEPGSTENDDEQESGPDDADNEELPTVELGEVEIPHPRGYPSEEERPPTIPAPDEFDFNCFISNTALTLALIVAFISASLAVCMPVSGIVSLVALLVGIIALISSVTGCNRCTVLRTLVWAIDVTIFILALEIPICAIGAVPVGAILLLARNFWLIPAIKRIPGCEVPDFTEAPPFIPMRKRQQRFKPSIHGFKFPNEFQPIALGAHMAPGFSGLELPTNPGLCAGMCYLAKDYYLATRDIPAQESVPIPGSPLYRKLFDRQLDSFGTGGIRLMENFGIAALSDEQLQGLTAVELDRMLPMLDALVPVNVNLILKSAEDLLSEVQDGRADAIWIGHAVIAYDYERTSSGEILINIYDPNYHNHGNIWIRATRFETDEGPRVSCTVSLPIPDLQRTKTRGFTIDEAYSYQQP